MRPIERGAHPVDANGASKTFAEYKDAKADLLERLGPYCSYCERHIPAGSHVEHVQPKSLHPGLATDWGNFLLACVNCNASKGDTDVQLDGYYWPDTDNTFLAFGYCEGGEIEVRSDLTDAQTQKAQATLALTGLDKAPQADPKAKDTGWNDRREAWGIAREARASLVDDDTEAMRRVVGLCAWGGHFSVWMTVFSDDPDMLRRFIKAFPGTCHDCFDVDGNSVKRPGGAL